MSAHKPDFFAVSKLPSTGTTIFSVMSALAAKHNAINLSQGFPDFAGPEELIERVHHHMLNGNNQYAPSAGIPELRQKLAGKFQALYNHTIDPETEITITAGATQALFTFIMATVNPGDEVILFAPAYDCYAPAIMLAGGIPVFIALEEPDFSIPWEKLRQKFSRNTRLIIVNNPHNPCASVLNDKDPEKFAELISGTNCLMLSDEVYEHVIFDNIKHNPLLLHPGLRNRTFSVYSFGKTFHFTGWKTGYGIGSPELTREFRKVHQYNVFSVNTPVQYAMADFLDDASHYLELPAFYQAKRDVFENGLKNSKLKPLPAKGSYFLLADYSAVSDEKDTDFAIRLTKEHGVACIPLSPFYPLDLHPQGKYVRFCFAKENNTLLTAIDKLCEI